MKTPEDVVVDIELAWVGEIFDQAGDDERLIEELRREVLVRHVRKAQRDAQAELREACKVAQECLQHGHPPEVPLLAVKAALANAVPAEKPEAPAAAVKGESNGAVVGA